MKHKKRRRERCEVRSDAAEGLEVAAQPLLRCPKKAAQTKRSASFFRPLRRPRLAASALGGARRRRPALSECLGSKSPQNKKPPYWAAFCFGRGRRTCFSAEKPRRLQRAPGTLPRAAFQVLLFIISAKHRPDRVVGPVFWQGQKDLNPRHSVLEWLLGRSHANKGSRC